MIVFCLNINSSFIMQVVLANIEKYMLFIGVAPMSLPMAELIYHCDRIQFRILILSIQE